jgi:hypothetical protein
VAHGLGYLLGIYNVTCGKYAYILSVLSYEHIRKSHHRIVEILKKQFNDMMLVSVLQLPSYNIDRKGSQIDKTD